MVTRVHSDLVISRESVHEAKKLVAGRGVHYKSIRGRGKLSFGHARLTSVKSMQSHHFPFSFLTRTTLANQSGYSTSRIALAWRSLLTSSLIAFCLSGAKLLLFCLTGLKEGLMFSLCVITVGLIL